MSWPCESSKLSHRNVRELLSIETGERNFRYEALDEFIECSEKFPIKPAINTVQSKTLKKFVPESILLRNVNSSYPVLHECVLGLFVDFLQHKCKYGSKIEKKFYKNMNFLQFVDRLLNKRAVTFVGKIDGYLLLNGELGIGGWENVGKDDEGDRLTLEKCLSYDEMKLSAFLSVSSYTHCINDGSRYNKGVMAEDRDDLEQQVVIIGLIGPRMVKKYAMEYQDIVIERHQNVEDEGYGTVAAPSVNSLFSKFYGKSNWTYESYLNSEESKVPGRFVKLMDDAYFDNSTYSKRIAVSIDTLLFEANHRAKAKETSAFVHVVGIGLGVWRVSSHQPQLFLDACAERIELLGKYLFNTSDVHFAYFPRCTNCGKYEHGSKIPIEGHPNGGIRIFIADRQPHEALIGENEGKLSVVSFAWDANALPGNEFWEGHLNGSGDSAAASSTQITEIHNPHINRNVSGYNLRIAVKGEVVPFQDYLKKTVRGIRQCDAIRLKCYIYIICLNSFFV